MTNEQQGNEQGIRETQTTLDTFLEHAQGVTQSLLNLKFKDVRYHLDSIEAIYESADESERQILDLLHIPIKEFALGFQQRSTAKTPEDQEQALAHLTAARDALRKTREDHQKRSKSPDFVQFALGVELTLLTFQAEIAKAQDDKEQEALLKAQCDRLIEDMISPLEPDDPNRLFLEAVKLFQDALPKFGKGMVALQEMNLDLAQQYLQEASESLSEMQDRFSKAEIHELMVKVPRLVLEGFALLIRAHDVYVRTLRKAIVGDVNRSDIEALERAERDFIDGADQVAEGASMMPSLFGGMDLRPKAKALSQLTRNLRTLAERSLTPTQLTRTGAPMAMIYFIGTFLVLLLGLPISGLVTELDSSDLGLLVIVSLLVSVIGTFGLQATKLVPLFEVIARLFKAFARLVPWGRRSRE